MSFAAVLSQRVSAKRQETKEREKEGQKWLEHETKLVDSAVDLFKRRCVRAAENMQCQLSVSFEVLTREVPGFPTYTVKDSTYLVDSWGDAEPAMWFYARRGPTEPFTHGLPIQFAELLEGMMPQFMAKVKELGFKSCSREAGTWKVRVSWQTPQEAAQNGGFVAETNGHAAGRHATASLVAAPAVAPAIAARSPPLTAVMEDERPRAYDGASRSRSRSVRPRQSRKSRSKSPTEVPSGTEVPTSDAEGGI